MKKNFFSLLLTLLLSFCVGMLSLGNIHYPPKTGTYIGAYQYKGYLDTSYLRISFINDSIFVFEFSKYKGDFNNFNISTSDNKGIARLINYKGNKSWIGIIDYGDVIMGKKYKANEDFLNVKRISDFEQAVNPNVYKDKNIWQNNFYVLLKFEFIGNTISVNTIENSQKFYINKSILHKIDNQFIKLQFSQQDMRYMYNTVAYNFFQIHYNNFNIKADTKISLLPISETNEYNIVQCIHANSKVRGYASFMGYIFIVQFDSNKNIIKYGWILRDKLIYLE